MNYGPRIMVVDDKESSRFMVKGYLEDAGYQITCVGDGVEALAELQRSPVDLIISDLVMPEMDGIALLRRVHTLLPHLPFVLITAYGSVDNAVAAMKEGADDYLLKPLNWRNCCWWWNVCWSSTGCGPATTGWLILNGRNSASRILPAPHRTWAPPWLLLGR